jgi:FdhE protein
MTCPNCEKRNKKMEFMSIEGAGHKWADLCSHCRTYIVGIDMRKQTGIITDIAALSMVHLDIIAQKKGYSPIAECAWNMVSPNEQILSSQNYPIT